MSSLSVQKFELGPVSTNAFLLWEEKGTEAVLIDAPPDSKAEIKAILKQNGLSLREIWLTHGHWDHIAGVNDLVENDTKIRAHNADSLLFENPEIMSGFSIPGIDLSPVRVDFWITEGDTLDLFGRNVSVFHCPGHCPGNVAFYLAEENLCFVGDVIFAGSIGRTDLPGGSFEQLEQSIRHKIYTLPEKTELAVGHGPDTTVGQEKISNPFVR